MDSLNQYIDYYQGSNYDLNGTDKNTTHSYGVLYNTLLSPYRKSYKSIVEIGVKSGGSCSAFADYFENATIYGLDINYDYLIHGKENKRIKYILSDATNEKCLELLNLKEIDLVIDDGSHNPQDQILSAKIFLPLISKNSGIYICEDIHELHSDFLKHEFEKLANKNNMILKWYDLRMKKGRFDDIVAVFHY